jgi:hypothetical protein
MRSQTGVEQFRASPNHRVSRIPDANWYRTFRKPSTELLRITNHSDDRSCSAGVPTGVSRC